MVAGSSSTVFFNEFHYDNDGTDTGEFIEIANTAGTDLTGWSVVLYNGNGGAPYATVALSGSATLAVLNFPSNGIQNGSPDGFALVDDGGTVVQFLSYEGTFTGVGGAANGLLSTDVGVAQASTTPVGSSLHLTGTGTTYGDFSWSATTSNSSGSINAGQDFGTPPPPLANVFLSEIHYDNDGADVGEFIEVTGTAGTDLTGWSILLYNGNGGAVYDTIALSGIIDDEGAGQGALAFFRAGIQNGAPDGFALVDDTGTLVEFLSYEGSFTAVGGAADGVTSTDIGVSEPGNTPVGQSLQKIGDTWVGPQAASPGDLNAAPPPPPAAFVINEYRVAQSGTNADFVELLGAANTSLSGLTLLAISGEFAPGRIDFALDLSAGSTDANGFFLIADTNFSGSLDSGDIQTTFNFFNSPQTLLLVSNFTGTAGADLDTDDDGVFDSTPWDAVITGLSLVDGDANVDRSYAAEIFGPDGNFTPAAGARVTDGTGAFQLLAFGSQAADTPGATNVPPPPPPSPTAAIYEIQGAGHTSPLVGQSVTTTGIVTAVASNGFYLQDPVGDGNIATSDAIFVFTASAPSVAVGDEASVSGTVSEFFPGGAGTGNLSTTQISGNPTVSVLSMNNALPAAVVLGGDRSPPTEVIEDDNFTSFDPETDGIDFFESLEGMLVEVNQPLAVSGTNQFGEIYTVVNGGVGATNFSARGTLNIDGTGGVLGVTDVGPGSDFNPERIQIDADNTITPGGTPNVTVGTLLNNITGVITYNFGNFEVVPTTAITVQTPSTLTPEVSSLVPTATDLLVASYNVLNLDPNDSDGDMDVANGRFIAIADDIVNALNAPDIIGLQEVQDNSGSVNDGTVSASATLQLLVDEIAAAGGPVYAWIDNTFITNNSSGGQPGANIRTAFLYNPERVDLVEGSVTTIGDQGAGGAFIGARLPLVATFTFNGNDITVVNNHFSSKGGSTPLFGTTQPSVNGGFDERVVQAQAVADYVAAEEGKVDGMIVLGDFNEFEFEDPLDPLYDAGLENLTNTLPEEERYTFLFDGNSQSLDHIFVTANLADRATFDIVHVNVEFAAASQASDHEPLQAAFTLAEVGARQRQDGSADGDQLTGVIGARDVISGGDGDDVINGLGNNDWLLGNAGNDVLIGGSGDDALFGNRGDDVLIGGLGDDRLRGGRGDDVLNGGQGADTFIFEAGAGKDVIEDFTIGEDTIEFVGGVLADFADLQAAASQDGADVLISYGKTDVLRIENLLLTDLASDQFLFG